MQHAAPMRLSLGLQTLCEYSMRRPWALPFLDTVAFSEEFHGRGGANPTPSRSPCSRSKCAFLDTVAFSEEFHRRGGANPTPSRSPSSRSKCASTKAASLQPGSSIAGASGSPTAKVELRDDTQAFRASQRRNSNAAATVTAFVHFLGLTT